VRKYDGASDRIADYVEWTENRYNPGYYLGGNIVPHLRKSRLSRRGRRLSGALLAISGFMEVVVSIAFVRVDDSWMKGAALLSVALALLTCWAAVVMFRSAGTFSGKPPMQEESP
jgi:hypothetical protein